MEPIYGNRASKKVRQKKRSTSRVLKEINAHASLNSITLPTQESISEENSDWKNLMLRHLGLASSLARGYTNIPGVEFDDILQQARIGLARAAISFDHRKGASFSTYAWKVIQNDLNTLYCKQRRRTINESSYFDDQQFQVSEGQTTEDLIPDDSVDVHTELLTKESHEAVHRAVKKLPYRFRKVIEGVLAGHDYRHIGKELGFSDVSAKTLVSRAYYEALRLLRIELKRNGFE